MRTYFFKFKSNSVMSTKAEELSAQKSAECIICCDEIAEAELVECKRCCSLYHIDCLREAYLCKSNSVQFGKCPYCTNALPIKLRLEFVGGINVWLTRAYAVLLKESDKQTNYKHEYRIDRVPNTFSLISKIADSRAYVEKLSSNTKADIDFKFYFERKHVAIAAVLRIMKAVDFESINHSQLRAIGYELIKARDYEITKIDIRETDAGPLRPLFMCNKHSDNNLFSLVDETGFCRLCQQRYCIRCHEMLTPNHVCDAENRRRATIQNSKILCPMCGSHIAGNWQSFYCKVCSARWLIEKYDEYYIRRQPIQLNDLKDYEIEALYSLIENVTSTDARTVIYEIRIRLTDERHLKILKFLTIAYSAITNFTIHKTIEIGTMRARETAKFAYIHSKAKDIIEALKIDKFEALVEEIEEELKTLDELFKV